MLFLHKNPKKYFYQKIVLQEIQFSDVDKPWPLELSCSCTVGTCLLLTPLPAFLAVDISPWLSAQEMRALQPALGVGRQANSV